MIAIDFPQANLTLRPPATMPDEHCIPLRVFQGTDENGYHFCLSIWQPSKEDLESLNAGNPIALKVLGTTQPPVALFTVNEKGEANV